MRGQNTGPTKIFLPDCHKLVLKSKNWEKNSEFGYKILEIEMCKIN